MLPRQNEVAVNAGLVDSHGRVMRDLRVSLTERCNFRCLYCLPETEEAANFYRVKMGAPKKSQAPFVFKLPERPRVEILSFEEIERLVRIAVSLGIQKVRLTGGEPLLRKDLPDLVRRIAAIPGIDDLAMTTNGFLFEKRGRDLARAGLKRVSFSMDSLDAKNFKKITGRDGLNEVLGSIRLAKELGLAPVKVNAVVIRGINDHELETLAAFAGEEGFSMRFIEFMPLDSSRAWLKEMVVPGREILQRLQARFALEPVAAKPSETARRWKIHGTDAEIGIIAPVTEPFCGHCNRLRLTADGKMRTCLFSVTEHDVRGLLRAGADDLAIARRLREIVGLKEDRHHIGEEGFQQPERSMSCIGG
jgi:cyclic pyranopterin phosphate synthase